MGRPAKLTAEEFLDRATGVFWERGCGVSARDLQEALGLRAPAIYRRFGSKDQLLAACIEHFIDTVVVDRIQQTLESNDDPMSGLHRYFVAALEPKPDAPAVRGCLLTNTAAHTHSQVPEVRAALFRGWQLVDSAFRTQIERAKVSGQINPGVDAESVSQALVMSLQGLLTLARAGVTDLRPGIDATFRLLVGDNAP